MIDTNHDNTTAQESKLFLADDPALAVLYSQIRDKSIKTLQGAEMIPQGAEFRFIMQTARLYDRMGCDVLALSLGLFCPLHLTPPSPSPNNHPHTQMKTAYLSKLINNSAKFEMTNMKNFFSKKIGFHSSKLDIPSTSKRSL